MEENLKKVLSYQSWRQSVDLQQGVSTLGRVAKDMWEFIGLPINLKNKSFLDIGSNDGLFSFETEEKAPFRFRYNLAFIEQLLNKYGFKVVNVKELNYYYVFLDRFHNIPKVSIPKGTKIFAYPEVNEEFTESEEVVLNTNGEYNGFLHIDGKGWIKKDDVKIEYNKPSKAYKLAKTLGFMNQYMEYVKKREGNKNDVVAYTIKAVKV